MQAFRQETGGALCTGDDVVGLCAEPHGTQVLGNLIGCARGVVGDVQGASGHRSERVDRARRGFVTPEHGAVEVEKQAIVFLRKGCHVR